jgi:hypothetical protein
MTSPAALVGVYRARNAHLVRELVAPALERGWQVAWWALDEVVGDLAPLTVGSGAGPRLALLNGVLERGAVRAGWVVVSDDDVLFERGDVTRLVAVAERARLDLAQPARSDAGVDHGITAFRRLSRARRTSFVEIGPVFVVGPRWRDRVLPFPAARGMGWGLELDWLELFREGCELGIVDAVRVRHEGERGEDYDDAGEIDRVHAELAALGYRGWSDVQVTLDTWRPWHRTPRWGGGRPT